MNHSISCATLIVILLFSPSLTASPIDDKVTALKEAVKNEMGVQLNKVPDTPPSAADAKTSYLLSLMASLDRIASQMDNPNMVNNVEMQVSQILSAYSSSQAVQKAGQGLLNEIHQERKAHVDAATTEIQILLKRVSDVVPKAKKAEDLDKILDDLQKILSDRYGYHAENQALYQKTSAAFEFTKLWQDYLSHLVTGQTQLVVNDLQNINQNNYGTGIIPRSQILDRLAAATALTTGKGMTETFGPPSKTINILKGIKTLDDMEPALQQLALLSQGDPQTAKAYGNLAPLVQIYTSIKAGLPETANLNFVSNDNELGISSKLQAQLLVFILQHYFDSYQGAAPTPGEKPQTFVNQVIIDAISREDWPLLRKALAGQAYLNRNSALTVYASGNISGGIENLLAGVNQETAAQYSLAVVSYQNALKVSDITVTAKLIGEKLAGIKRDHPKEYEEGMQMVVSPVVAKYPPTQGMANGTLIRPGTTGNPNSSDPVSRAFPIPSIPGTTIKKVDISTPPAPDVSNSNQPPIAPSSPDTSPAK